MRVNGCIIPLNGSQGLFDFLEVQNYDITKIAVERNGEIVPKSTYKFVVLDDEDTLEIVRFVGGG